MDDLAKFRLAIYLGVALATVMFGLTFIPAIRYSGPSSSGLEWLGVFGAAPIYVTLVLPALALGIFGGKNGLIVAAALLGIAMIASILVFN